MKPIEIDTEGATALEMIPESCGDVTVGCTDVAGIVEAVLKSSEILRDEHNSLRETVTALEADQTKVAEASDEARLLSERAIERLGEEIGRASCRERYHQCRSRWSPYH